MLNKTSQTSLSHFMLTIALFIVVHISHGQAQDLNRQESLQSARPDRSEQPGLLVLSHGAPMPQWNDPVNALIDRVRELNKNEKTFHMVEGAFLEFTQPDAAAGVKKLEDAGCDRIIVVPLFIAPSSHSHFDVPAVLGLYTSPQIREVLEEEGACIAQPNVPVTITQTLSEGDILDQFALDEFRALSEEPSNEAIILLAHGCPDHHRLVDMTVRRIATFCCGQCQIDYGDWAYCAMGQTYLEEAFPALIRGSEKKKRVLVVGLYVSSSAQGIYERAMKRASERTRTAIQDALEGMEIVFSKRSVVEHEATANWVLQTAGNALNAIMGHAMQHGCQQ